jgi:hypothetical protein
MMNEEGFPKRSLIYAFDGQKLDAMPECTSLNHDHTFLSSGMMQKLDESTAGDYIVIYRVYVCSACLVHIFTESPRIKSDTEIPNAKNADGYLN